MGFTLSSKMQDLFLLNLKIKQESRVYQNSISISSKIREFKKKNLKFKQDLRILNTESQLWARFKNDKMPSFSCQWGQNTTSELKSTLTFKIIIGWHTLF